MECNTERVFNMSSLYARFQSMHDSRKQRGKRYALATILLGMFLAKSCGENIPSGIAECAQHRQKWITGMLELKRESMPQHNTYRRILADVIDRNEFKNLAREYFTHCVKAGYQVVVAIDGKVVRGTIDTDIHDGLCLLAVYLPCEGITLTQVALKTQQSEISAAPNLLGCIHLRNKVVKCYSLHT